MVGPFAQAAGDQGDDGRGEDDAECRYCQQDAKQGAAGVAQQVFQFFGVLGARRREDGNKGVGKAAFGEEAAQGVGNAQRGVEGVRDHGVEVTRHQHIAQQAEDARGERHHGKDGGRSAERRGHHCQPKRVQISRMRSARFML